MTRTPLFEQVARSSRDQAAIAAMIQVLSLAQTVVLARVFYPTAFGALACALVYLQFFSSIGTAGIDRNLIRQKTLTPKLVGTSFILGLARDGVTFAAYLACAAPFAAFFGHPGLFEHLLILSPLVFHATLHFPVAFLEREFRFRAVNIPRVLELLLFPLIALVLRSRGFGAVSLIWAYMASELVTRLLLWGYARVRIPLAFDRKTAVECLVFSIPLSLSGLMGLLALKLDDLFVGYFAGPTILGFYSLAYYKPMFITQMVNMLQRVMYSAFARIRDDRDRSVRLFVEGSRYTALFVFPAAALVAVFAEPLVVHVFSAKWRDAAPLLRLFALGIGMRLALTGPWIQLAVSRGETRPVFVSSCVDLGLLFVGGLPMIAFFGATGGAVYFVLHAVVSVWIVPLPTVRRILGGWPHLPGLALPAAAAAVAATAGALMNPLFGATLGGLIVEGAIASAIYLGVLFLCGCEQLPQAMAYLRPAARQSQART